MEEEEVLHTPWMWTSWIHIVWMYCVREEEKDLCSVSRRDDDLQHKQAEGYCYLGSLNVSDHEVHVLRCLASLGGKLHTSEATIQGRWPRV